MTAIEAVIFDLDDTLYPERAFAFSGFTAVAEAFADRLGQPSQAAAAMQRLFDTEDRPRVYNVLLAERGLPQDDQLVARMIETYRSHIPGITLHPDANAALSRLRGSYKLGLITDGPVVTQRNKIDALGLSSRFDEIICTAALGAGFDKPHPRAFELMAERLTVAPARCVYAAANPAKDFVAPNALGWTTIQIQRDDGIYLANAPAKRGQPGHTITTLDGLLTDAT